MQVAMNRKLILTAIICLLLPGLRSLPGLSGVQGLPLLWRWSHFLRAFGQVRGEQHGLVSDSHAVIHGRTLVG